MSAQPIFTSTPSLHPTFAAESTASVRQQFFSRNIVADEIHQWTFDARDDFLKGFEHECVDEQIICIATVHADDMETRITMAKTTFRSVDEYIASQPEAVQDLLKRVRITIRKAVPGTAEMISYNIPRYNLYGRPVLYFAGWSKHYSLYPATEPLVAAFKDDLAP